LFSKLKNHVWNSPNFFSLLQFSSPGAPSNRAWKGAIQPANCTKTGFETPFSYDKGEVINFCLNKLSYSTEETFGMSIYWCLLVGNLLMLDQKINPINSGFDWVLH